MTIKTWQFHRIVYQLLVTLLEEQSQLTYFSTGRGPCTDICAFTCACGRCYGATLFVPGVELRALIHCCWANSGFATPPLHWKIHRLNGTWLDGHQSEEFYLIPKYLTHPVLLGLCVQQLAFWPINVFDDVFFFFSKFFKKLPQLNCFN